MRIILAEILSWSRVGVALARSVDDCLYQGVINDEDIVSPINGCAEIAEVTKASSALTPV
jgi:hypothetical protein